MHAGGSLAQLFKDSDVTVHPGSRERGTLGLGAVLRLARLARRFDLVHTHLFAGDTWGRLAAAIVRAPIVTTEHNVNRDEGRHHRGIKRSLARWTDRLVFVSQAARRYAEEVEGICHPHSRVILNGVGLTRLRLAAPGPGTRFLAVGRDTPQKGFDLLLNALPEGVTLRIAGASKRTGVQHRNGARIEWLGERADVPDLLADTDVLVVPSRWEGFGLAAVEGMAAGVTVVASEVDALPEVLGGAGVLVQSGDLTALRAALTRVRDDAPLRARCAAAGRARSTAFSIGRCADEYAGLYAETVGLR